MVATVIAKVWHGLTSDGTLAAAARQGADELGSALKAFPESIQVQETGSIWNPTQGEIAADRSNANAATGKGFSSTHTAYSASSLPPHPWPSEVARDTAYQPGQDRSAGHDQSHDQSLSM